MTPRTLKLLKWPALILWTAFLIFTGRCSPAPKPGQPTPPPHYPPP